MVLTHGNPVVYYYCRTTTAETKKVMICDDEQDLLELYASVIEQKYNVITTVSGFECIKKYCEEKERGSHIDVLLLDYRLKDMLGDEVAQTIRKMNGTKIILISAYDLEEYMILISTSSFQNKVILPLFLLFFF